MGRPKRGKKMRVVNDGYEEVAVERLQRHPLNPRKGNTNAIKQSIRANGFYGAVIVQRSTDYVLAGWHRYDAALQDESETVPVMWVDVDDATAKRIVLVDNRTSDLATYDESKLAELLDELKQEGDLLGTAYDDSDVTKLLDELAGLTPTDTDTVTESKLMTGDADTDDEGERSWGVIVVVGSETEQVELLERLSTEGFEVRALMR